MLLRVNVDGTNIPIPLSLKHERFDQDPAVVVIGASVEAEKRNIHAQNSIPWRAPRPDKSPPAHSQQYERSESPTTRNDTLPSSRGARVEYAG